VAVGKCQPFGGIEVCQDKCYLRTKLGPERIDDALELSAVRSARQKYLYERRSLAEDVEATIPWLMGQRHDGHDGSNHHRSSDEQHDTAALTALPSSPRLLPHRFLTLAHRRFSHYERNRYRGSLALRPFRPTYAYLSP
jgi:hypothetical protein